MPGPATMDLRWLWEILSALGIGLLIGLEREHARVIPTGGELDPHAKGARTFALIAIYGYGAALCGERIPGMPLLALAGLALILSALHLRRLYVPPSSTTPGDRQPHGEDVTTEVAALSACLLGILVHIQLQAAVMIGVLVTTILIAKPWVHGLIARLRRRELTGTLQLLVAVLIVLPVIPDHTLDLPWVLSGLLNPRSVVLFIVLLATIGYVGYFLVRILGPRRGLALTGLLGGLTSSTAVTLAMGERVRRDPQLGGTAALGTLLACVVMVVRVLGLAGVVHPPLFLRLLWPVVAMGCAYLLVCGVLVMGRRDRRGQEVATEEHPPLALENPFELLPALKFGGLYVGVLLVSRIAHNYLGTRGLYLASLLAGLADVDPVTLNAARLAQKGESLTVGTVTIVLALASNTLAKTLMAFTSGGRTYGVRVAAGHAAALLCGGAVLLVIWLTG